MEFTGERYLPEVEGGIACEHLNRYHFALHQLKLTGKTVLDIASGEGYGSDLLAQTAAKVYGVDIDMEAIVHANQRYKRKNLTFIQGSATAIPLEDRSVDVVVSFETIEHLAEHQQMIDELKRVLKTDGILLLSSPNKANYSDKSNFDNSFHVKELYSDEFKALINANFAYATHFVQNTFVGSIITTDNAVAQSGDPLFISKLGEITPFQSKYSIALCSDKPLDKLKYTSVNYMQTDVIQTRDEFMYDCLMEENVKGQLKVYNSLAYRLGNVIVSPAKKIRKLLGKL